jgi:2-polyprenyl-6-methoxyphenol hydroxylase-like FAD-dependent oxidoreductase
MRSFEHVCPAARKIISFADTDVKVWVLYDMQSLPCWTRERLLLVGDAAHPFLPFTLSNYLSNPSYLTAPNTDFQS